MLLKIWNIFNCLLGSIFFIFYKENGRLRIKPCLLVCVPLTIVTLLIHTEVMVHTCNFFAFPGGEPQKYHCYLFWLANIIITLRRLNFISSTRELFVSVTDNFTFSSCFTDILRIVIVQLIAGFLQGVTFFITMKTTLLSFIIANVGYFYTLSHCFVIFQCSTVCYAVLDEIENLQKIFYSHSISSGDIKIVRYKFSCCHEIFLQFIRVFSIDMFLTVTVCSLGACVVLNSFINLSFSFLFTSLFTLPLYLSKIMFFVNRFVSFYYHVIWFSLIASSLNKKVTQTSKTVFKVNTVLLDDKAKEEIILFLEQLEGCTFSINAFGFFCIDKKLVFKSITSAVTFIVLFIQLSQMRIINNKLHTL